MTKQYSWEILNNCIAIKKADKSAFDHHGTAIPMGLKSFWNVDHIRYGDRKNIILKYKKRQYESHIVIDKYNRVRLYWRSDLSSVINNYKTENDFNLFLRFEKENSSTYQFSIIFEDYFHDQEEKSLLDINFAKNEEGKRIERTISSIERNYNNRKNCILYHGTKCKVCGFDFGDKYGEIGEGFIEIHHILPLKDLDKETMIDPITDLVPVCSNCHRMIHRYSKALSIQELKKIIR